jgi:predicted acetyltransferase
MGGDATDRRQARGVMSAALSLRPLRLDNIASMAVIEACGGLLDSVVRTAPQAPLIRRYWID